MTTLILIFIFLLPLIFWSVCYSALKGRTWELDWGSNQGSFLVPYALYRRLYWIIFSIGLVGAAFFAHSQYSDLAWLFLASSIYAFLFNGWVAYCYESFLHARYPATLIKTAQTMADQAIAYAHGRSNYSGGKMALTLALAFASLLLFLASLCLGTAALIER